MSKHSTPAYSWPSVICEFRIRGFNQLQIVYHVWVHTGWISRWWIHECGGQAMRLKRPESFVSTADPGDGPLWVLRDHSVPASSASLCPLRTCTRLSVVPFHTRQNQKGPAVPLLYVLTVCLYSGAHTATSNDWAISNMDGSHKYNLSDGS